MIYDYILNSIPYMVCSIPLYSIIRFVILILKKHRQKNWLHELGLFLFVMYCVGVASQTFIPKIEFGNTSSYILNQNIFGEINFIPGKVVFDTYNEINTYNNYIYFVINIIGNVCIFIPIGFFISVLWRNISVKKIVLIALFMSLCIELLQLPQARGTDIDDLWLNMLGALIGYLFYFLLSKAPSIQNIFYKFRVKQ